MRTVVLFALALFGLALVSDDALAGHCRKKKAHASDCGGCGSGGYGAGGYGAPGAYGRYGYADTGMSGAAYGGGYSGPYFNGTNYSVPGRDGRYYMNPPGGAAGTMTPAAMPAGRSGMIQTSDGRTYAMGADGNYYPASAGVAAGYMGQQPYPGSMNRGTTSLYTPGLIPAGGTMPLTMPGTNGVPSPMAPQK
jgi:hypothetical protein